MTFERDVVEERIETFAQSGSFASTVVNASFDRLWAKVQEWTVLFSNTVRRPSTSTSTASLDFPDPGADQYLKYNAAGTGLETAVLADVDAIVLPVSIVNGGTGSTTAADARTALDTLSATTPLLGGVLDTNSHAINESEGSAVASVAGTTNIWATNGNTLHVTGTEAITGLGTAPRIGARRRVIADAAFTLTHSANLNCPGGEDIVAAAGDSFDVYADTTTQHDIQNYTRASGLSLVLPSSQSVNLQVFTAGGTYTPTTGMKSCEVIITGGGGAGGASSTSARIGGGGAAAGTAIRLFTAAEIGASQTVVIGAGGTGGAGGGGSGSNSTFGAFLTASQGGGGAIGTTSANGPGGGGASGGDVNITGGGGAHTQTSAASVAANKGGASYWGGGGGSRFANNPGVAGPAPGSGGSGGVNAITTNQNGGSGADGICVIKEFL